MSFDFDYILKRPGLGFILVEVFLQVDIETLAVLDEVSDSWKDFFVINSVLEKKFKLLNNIESIYRKCPSLYNQELDDHHKRKKFILNISEEGIKSGWKHTDAFVKKVVHCDVKDMKVLGDNRLFHTSGPGVQLADRDPVPLQPCGDSQDVEYRLTGIKEFVGHR